jgi:hypothetical protein
VVSRENLRVDQLVCLLPRHEVLALERPGKGRSTPRAKNVLNLGLYVVVVPIVAWNRLNEQPSCVLVLNVILVYEEGIAHF